ncbi:MAG: AAA family ATPase [Candidatus Aenigmarchaeota archaeon]|nr:AAA family ATPase [Candidatus Aenigmarchaeota archaeon]
MATNDYGKIIVLNGTSSSGKSTIARALEKAFDGAYCRISLDEFGDELRRSRYPTLRGKPPPHVLDYEIARFHDAIAALAAEGANVIVDHVLEEFRWSLSLAEALAAYDVTLVGVHCPLAVVETREQERGDRKPGTARYQFGRVHERKRYDVTVDTSELPLQACAEKIISYVLDNEKAAATDTRQNCKKRCFS